MLFETNSIDIQRDDFNLGNQSAPFMIGNRDNHLCDTARSGEENQAGGKQHVIVHLLKHIPVGRYSVQIFLRDIQGPDTINSRKSHSKDQYYKS